MELVHFQATLWSCGTLKCIKLHSLSDCSRRTSELRSKPASAREAFTVRRCQMLLASAEGQHSTPLRATCGPRSDGPNAIHAFHQRGIRTSQPTSSRPHRPKAVSSVARSVRREQSDKSGVCIHFSVHMTTTLLESALAPFPLVTACKIRIRESSLATFESQLTR